MADLEIIKPQGVQNLINKFCYTIGIIPTSYKQSLTYEEQILAIGHYLETVVYPAINNNAEALTELQGLFVELKNYVDNYFDNLDVQEEINNKLDEMAESGDLEEIIASYINTKAVFGFDNVNSMVNAENLTDGCYTKTLGFYNKNDGGAALYKIRTITNDDVVNGMDIIEMQNDNTLIAELISDKNNVMCYGVEKNDTNNNNHTIIEYVLNKMNYAYCKEIIDLHNELILTGQNKKFDFFKINYTPTIGSAIIIHDTINYELNGTQLISNSNGVRLGLLEITSGVVVNIGRITAEQNSIYLGGAKGVLDSQFNVNRLEYKNHGIFFDLSQKWVGQIGFYNMVFADGTDTSVTENFAVYGNCSLNSITGINFYNISLEGAKGGFFFETTHNTFFVDNFYVYGCRVAELGYTNDHKVLKFKTGTNFNNVHIMGKFEFDEAFAENFDFSEFYSVLSRDFEISGIFRTKKTQYTNNIQRYGTHGILGYRKLVIDKLYSPYQNFNPSTEKTIIPLAEMLFLTTSGGYTNPVYNLKLTTDDYVLKGNFKIKVNQNSTINILNNSGNVVKTHNMTTGDVLNIFSVETPFSTDVQTLQYIQKEQILPIS